MIFGSSLCILIFLLHAIMSWLGNDDVTTQVFEIFDGRFVIIKSISVDDV